MFADIIFYIIVSSTVMIYGAGLNRAVVFSYSPHQSMFKLLKMFLVVITASTLSYLVSAKFLMIADLSELYPFTSLLIFMIISSFIESIIRITAKISASEFAISYLFVLIGTGESTSLTECLLISSSCILSFFMLIPFIIAIRYRSSVRQKNSKDFFLIYISIAIIIIITLAWNVSWLNPKVF